MYIKIKQIIPISNIEASMTTACALYEIRKLNIDNPSFRTQNTFRSATHTCITSRISSLRITRVEKKQNICTENLRRLEFWSIYGNIKYLNYSLRMLHSLNHILHIRFINPNTSNKNITLFVSSVKWHSVNILFYKYQHNSLSKRIILIFMCFI